MKKIITTIICLFMLFCMLSINAFGAQDFICNEPSTGNSYSHNYYYTYASVIKSYLVDCSDNTIMRFQYDSENSLMIAEYYSYDYEFIRGKIIPEELPVFGGFYTSDDYYFILTGMKNPDESASAECFRITKYDKNWNRIASAGLYDCNTTVPFDAGSARFAQCGDYLLIRTSHEMYASSDGLNHQANVTIELDMNTMQITDSFTDVWNSSYGYVSHSFNQFIKVEDNRIVAVDHGDAYPRSVILMKYNNDVTDGTFYGKTSNYEMVSIYGNTGNNYTGCTVGGFEISDSAYIVVGTSVIQNEEHFYDEVQNIYISSLSKETNEVTFNFITDYEDESPAVPFLVKLSDSEFLLMWEKDGSVFYTKLDSSGTLKGETYELTGELSDCEPIVVNGRILWYVYRNSTIDFYTISADNLSKTEKTSVYRGHEHELLSSQGSFAHLHCKKCSDETSGNVPESYKLWKATLSQTGYYASSLLNFHPANVGDTWIIYGSVYDESSDNFAHAEFTVSDPSIAVIQKTEDRFGETMYHVKFMKEGTVELRYSSVYLPEYGFTSTIEVSHSASVISVDKEPTCTENGLQTVVCSCCDKTFTEEIPAKGHSEVTVPGKSATCTESGLTDGSECSVCNIVTMSQEIIPALGHNWATEEGLKKCNRCDLTEEQTVQLIITSDKNPVKIGDTVTYTVSLGPVSQLAGIEFRLDIPEGLTFTDGALAEGLQTTLGAAACGFNPDIQKVVIAGGMSYTSGEITPILTFTCKVDKEFRNHIFMGVDTDNWYIENIYGEVEIELVNDDSDIYMFCEHLNTTVYEAVSPSCTETGLTAGEYCSDCDTVIKAQQIIPANGHSFGAWTVIKAPTDTDNGIEERVCRVCEKKETRITGNSEHLAGDVNSDGRITAADARIILRISAKLDKTENYNVPSEVFDVTKDSKITAADARKVLRISAKLE